MLFQPLARIVAIAAVLGLSHCSMAEVVTGAGAGRVDRTSPTPVSSVNSQDLDRSGSRPIMDLLRQTPAGKSLDDLGINVYGHVEMGYTYNFDNPDTRQNAFRVFDQRDNRGVFNQVDLSIERIVDYRKNKLDVGGLIELLYGEDGRSIHANGVFDYQSGRHQFDPVQFYADITLPILNGARLRVGKFANLVGYESINPTADYIGFYSRSFVFASGYPFTHTGALLTFDPCKNVTFTGGVTRGDEQSFEDNNSAVAFLGSLNWVINKQMALYIANSTGPEQDNDNDHYRTTWDVTFFYQPDDRWRFLLNGYFIYDGAGDPNGKSGILYSFAGLARYQLCKEAAAKVRAEYFRDEDGLRSPAKTNLYEITVGLDVVPFASHKLGRNLMIRPELRYDFSDDPIFNGEKHQFTFGIDAIFKM